MVLNNSAHAAAATLSSLSKKNEFNAVYNHNKIILIISKLQSLSIVSLSEVLNQFYVYNFMLNMFTGWSKKWHAFSYTFSSSNNDQTYFTVRKKCASFLDYHVHLSFAVLAVPSRQLLTGNCIVVLFYAYVSELLQSSPQRCPMYCLTMSSRSSIIQQTRSCTN